MWLTEAYVALLLTMAIYTEHKPIVTGVLLIVDYTDWA